MVNLTPIACPSQQLDYCPSRGAQSRGNCARTGSSSLKLVASEFQVGAMNKRPHQEKREEIQSYIRVPTEATRLSVQGERLPAEIPSACFFLAKMCALLQRPVAPRVYETMRHTRNSFVSCKGRRLSHTHIGKAKPIKYDSSDCNISRQQSRAFGPITLII